MSRIAQILLSLSLMVFLAPCSYGQEEGVMTPTLHFTMTSTDFCEGDDIPFVFLAVEVHNVVLTRPDGSVLPSPYVVTNATMSDLGRYHLSGTSTSGQTLSDDIDIMVHALPDIEVSNDVTIQPGGSTTLWARNAAFFLWSPSTGLSDSIGSPVTATPLHTTTYTVRGYNPGAEYVVNGDFEDGNTGFTSDYIYSSNLIPEGNYYVGSNPQNYHPAFHGSDHTSGTGMFMIVNGSGTPNTRVWSETVTVLPNCYYAFSTWVCSVSNDGSPLARLQFSINGSQLGDVFVAPSALNHWEKFYQIWYSGNSTQAVITILNQNTNLNGNDFGLDDISFCLLSCPDTRQVTVYVDEVSADDDMISVCYEKETRLGFLENDDLPLGCQVPSVSIVTLPWHGDVTDYTDWKYLPDDGFSGLDSLQYSVGCGQSVDSAWVFITVDPLIQNDIYVESCDSYTWHGQTYTQSTDVSFTETTQNGCDSLVWLHLTIWHPVENTIFIQSCESYEWNGTFYNVAGTYQQTFENIHGCDSIVTLVLSLSDSFFESYDAMSCEEYQWRGRTLAESGVYYDTVVSSIPSVCDSVFELHLSVVPPYSDTLRVTECSSYTWRGHTYTNSAFDSFVIPGMAGCDSVFYLDLTIISTLDLNLRGLTQVSVATSSWPGSYNYYIDSTFVTGEVEWTMTNGDWVINPHGAMCTLHVTTIDTGWLVARVGNSGCQSVDSILINATYFGVDEYGPIDASVFPNPADDRLYIKAEGIVAVKLYDVMGQLVQRHSFDADDLVTLDIHDCDAAMYFVEVETQRGKTVKRIVVSRR